MQEELNRRIRQGDAQRIKPRDPKEMAAEGQREMRAQMTRLKTSVANAVSKRRFLFDQYKVDARKRDARKNVCECLQFFFLIVLLVSLLFTAQVRLVPCHVCFFSMY
jgi:hypothetical protein